MNPSKPWSQPWETFTAPPPIPHPSLDPGTGRREEDVAETERIEGAKMAQYARANRCECGYLICSCDDAD